MKKAVVLLSGGIDSATCAAIAKEQGFSLHALTFSYGQRHRIEIGAAHRIASFLGAAEHRIVPIDPCVFGDSALTSPGPVPKNRPLAARREIPPTYVPARNTIFLSYALAWAEVIDSRDIFIGANAVDYSGYPDCRPEYIAAFERMANLATRAGTEGGHITVHAPLINLTKAEIIRAGTSLGLDLRHTHSCYDPAPDGRACGQCDSCRIRAKGFAEAGIEDETAAPWRERLPN